jgi:hypothetical protein
MFAQNDSKGLVKVLTNPDTILVLKATDIESEIKKDLLEIDDDSIKLAYYSNLKRIQAAIESAAKDVTIKEVLSESFYKVKDNDKVRLTNATITYGATYTKYNFDNCEHPVLDFLKAMEDKFKELRKSTEEELKAIPEVENKMGDDGVTSTYGKKIFIDVDDVVAKLNFVAEQAQIVIDTIDSTGGIFKVYRPIKEQQLGLKIAK